MRVLGIDPGLTRCGIGVVEGSVGRPLTLVDVNDLGEAFEVVSEPTDLVAVRSALQAAGIDYDSAEASFVPDMQVALDADAAGKMFRLIDALEDLDDVQNVYANYDVPDAVMESLDA